MSYRVVLEQLRAYEPKRLIVGAILRGGECCALGAVADPIEREVAHEHAIGSARGLRPLQIASLMDVNDNCIGTPEQRYAHVLAWLEAQVAAEGGAT